MTYINTSHFQTYIPYNENSFNNHDLKGKTNQIIKIKSDIKGCNGGTT